MQRRVFFLLLAWLACASAAGQGVTVVRGRVTDGRDGVPYATLQVVGTGTGVCCNDRGEYELRLAAVGDGDSVLVRSLGYEPLRVPLGALVRDGRVRLRAQPVELREVSVRRYRRSQDLMLDVLRCLEQNFRQETAYSTFFYRDWRTVDGELFLFDEAVMEVERDPYGSFAGMRSFRWGRERDLESNNMTLLRHRLLVCDRALLRSKVRREEGVEAMMDFAGDRLFYDPAQAPDASYALARKWLQRQHFSTPQEFSDGDETYYLVRSTGASALSRKTRYEYVIRQRGLALVRVSSWLAAPVTKELESTGWRKAWFTHRVVEADSSSWTYDERGGQLTLVRYHTSSTQRLLSRGRGHDGEEQLWQMNVEWTLTGFADSPSAPEGATVGDGALDRQFGPSDYTSDFWGPYNTVPVDTRAVQLLLSKIRPKPTP